MKRSTGITFFTSANLENIYRFMMLLLLLIFFGLCGSVSCLLMVSRVTNQIRENASTKLSCLQPAVRKNSQVLKVLDIFEI